MPTLDDIGILAVSGLGMALFLARVFGRLTFTFAWYDLWIGVYIDRAKGRIYVFPVPMLGLRFDWRGSAQEEA